jgi:hypothetical protein
MVIENSASIAAVCLITHPFWFHGTLMGLIICLLLFAVRCSATLPVYVKVAVDVDPKDNSYSHELENLPGTSSYRGAENCILEKIVLGTFSPEYGTVDNEMVERQQNSHGTGE